MKYFTKVVFVLRIERIKKFVLSVLGVQNGTKVLMLERNKNENEVTKISQNSVLGF